MPKIEQEEAIPYCIEQLNEKNSTTLETKSKKSKEKTNI